MKHFRSWVMVFTFFCLSAQQGLSQCASDRDCDEGKVCAPDGSCAIRSQDVSSEVCGKVQRYAQKAVLEGSPYRNHGQLVRTASQAVTTWLEAGIITEECSGAIMGQFGEGVPIGEQEAVAPHPSCVAFMISGTLVAVPGSDHDTLGFAGSTFVLDLQTDAHVVPTIETRYLYGIAYTRIQFDYTSSSALRWSPSGSAFDGTYMAPASVILEDNKPFIFPGLPDPLIVDGIELNSIISIGGIDHQLRMLFYFNDGAAFDRSNNICTFEVASTAGITVQQLATVPYMSTASYDLRVADIVFATSRFFPRPTKRFP